MDKNNINTQIENISQRGILIEYYLKNENRDIQHKEIVDWVTNEYLKRTGKVFRDPDRGIRQLHQEGYLIKISNGIYKYDPELVIKRELQDFTPEVKKQIFERDNYQCTICGRGKKEGMNIHADHIKAKDLGGLAVLENGQTLCSQHNFLKKNLGQTETGKKMFIRLYDLAKLEHNISLIKFCEDILNTFEKHNINGHIEWKR